VDDGRPVIAALLHGGGDGIILGRVIDDVEVGEEEVDNAVGGRELTMQPRQGARSCTEAIITMGRRSWRGSTMARRVRSRVRREGA
jgi:hypothetical protein